MIVGFMRTFKNPTRLAKALAIANKAQGIDLLYFQPSDVDVIKNRILGKVFIENKWKTVSADIPKFVDVNQFCYKKRYKTVMDYLEKTTRLSDTNLNKVNKIKLQNALKKDEKYMHLVIPTKRITDFNSIRYALDEHKIIVLKPINGSFGNNIYICEKQDVNHYKLKFRNTEKNLTLNEFKSFYEANIEINRYIIQKYIDSTTAQGNPFDCRICVEKDGNGEWVLAKKFIRIGIGQKAVSNISKGGGVSATEPFLKFNFGDKWHEVENKLVDVSLTLPKKMEKLRNYTLMTLGIDVGIDKLGNVYVFEVNSSPGNSQSTFETSLYRSQYYKYVLTEELGLNINEYIFKFTSSKLNDYTNKQLKENHMLQKRVEIQSREIDKINSKTLELQNYTDKQLKRNISFQKKVKKLSKELDNVYNSNSWKVTGPLRYLGGLLKYIKR